MAGGGSDDDDDDDWTPAKIRQALDGNDDLLEDLVGYLTPLIQIPVARAVLGWTGHRNVGIEVEDIVQEVFFHLFEKDGQVLRSWDPSKGSSLKSFIGLVAKRQAISILRTGKTCPFKEDPTDDDDLDGVDMEADSESILVSKDILEKILDFMIEELSPKGWDMFDLLFLEELSVEEVMEQEKMTRSAVDQWKCRIRKLARRLLRELLEEPPDA